MKTLPLESSEGCFNCRPSFVLSAVPIQLVLTGQFFDVRLEKIVQNFTFHTFQSGLTG
jgi:hypothetical protein